MRVYISKKAWYYCCQKDPYSINRKTSCSILYEILVFYKKKINDRINCYNRELLLSWAMWFVGLDLHQNICIFHFYVKHCSLAWVPCTWHKLQSDRDLLIHVVKSFKESFLQSEHHSLLKYHIAAVHRHSSFAIQARIPNVFKGAGSGRLFNLQVT